MRIFLFVGVLLIGMINAAHAQSLEIGGIELRLGQKVDEALRSLSTYQVQYIGDIWLVSQKVGDMYMSLGVIGATDKIISYISKSFNINENEDAPKVYTRAANELHRLGGTTCATHERVFSDSLIHGFETQCGPFKLIYDMPMKDAEGRRILGSVSISIRTELGK